MRGGKFRAPLLHRLAGFEIFIPPLRERIDDLGRLFVYFLRQELERVGEANRLDEAETVYWEDLKRNAESGWSLAGLLEVLNAQGKKDQAALVQVRLQKAWRDSDFRRSVQTNQN